MSTPQDIAKPKYHWWYDSKAAGVRNPPPGMGMNINNSPPSSGSSPSGVDSAPRRFSFTSGLTALTSSSPPAGDAPMQRPRRDSLKQIYLLSDFGTPGT